MDFQHFLTYMTDQGKIGFLMAKDWETGKLHFFVGSCHGLNTAIDMNQRESQCDRSAIDVAAAHVEQPRDRIERGDHHRIEAA